MSLIKIVLNDILYLIFREIIISNIIQVIRVNYLHINTIGFGRNLYLNVVVTILICTTFTLQP